jgi:CRP-like cAMP-binding protein
VAFLFLPRQYEKGSTIIKKGEEFHEILLQTDGELKGMLACDPPVSRYYHKGFFLGDYEVIHNKRSMLTYETTGAVKFLALPKHKFLKILEKYPEICEEMKINSVEQHTQQKNRYVYARLL